MTWKHGRRVFAVAAGVWLMLAGTAPAGKGRRKAAPAATGVVRVACVGDSITYGAAIRDRARSSYPAQLQRLLGGGWAVRNFGVNGATMLKKGDKPYWKQRAFRDAQAFAPNVVVIMLGTNDSKPDNWKYKDQFAADCRAMIETFRKLPSRPKIWLCYPVPVARDRWGIRESVVKGEVIPILESVVKQAGVGAIDLHGPLSGKEEMFADGVHPTAAGAGIMAEVIANVLKKNALGPAGRTDPPGPGGRFPGKKGKWHGFECYYFTVDGRRCRVVVPAEAAPGRPWIWRARFFGHEPQADIALLKKGFHLVYMDVAGLYGCPQAVRHWDAFYAYLTGNYGLARRAVLEGMSRGGLIVYNWAEANPDKVACIYADAPVCDIRSWPGGKGSGHGSPSCWAACKKLYGLTEKQAETFKGNPIDHLEPLARAGVPLLHVCGDADGVVPYAENTAVLAERYRKLGGKIQVILKKGVGHHPHSLKDPAPIVEFILRHTIGSAAAGKAAAGKAAARGSKRPGE
ncbi:MAG: prolyl oligopeptidase family serine peptidase [Planctomycetes bacterium]|nr:prolyl oligopeptidase family serine peptidase [Planctomycetota bacterium]